jgi:hypothetical protein
LRRAAALLLLVPPPPAIAQDARAGDVRRVTDPAGREASYPTRLAEIVSATAVARATAPDAAIATGESVLTKSALTHVRMAPGQPEAALFANTLVRFDAVNQWLLRQGAAFIVNRRGKLSVVVEGLETLFVGSEVYVEKTPAGLLAYVVEGHVVIGAAGMAGVAPTGLGLGPDQAARVPPGGVAEHTDLTAAERTRVLRQIDLARRLVKAPSVVDRRDDVSSHGGAAAGVVLGLGAAGAGVYLLTKDDPQPDLVPVPGTGGAVCTFDAQQRPIVRVANAGEGDAPATSTRIGSPRGGMAILPTPALAAGETTVLAVPATALCVCPVDLTVDADGRVGETDEQNNTLQQACAIGSAR